MEYYSLPYCKPFRMLQRVEDLGEILAGDQILNSPYELKMKSNEFCKILCGKAHRLRNPRFKNRLRDLIDNNYKVNWIVDNLPASTKYLRTDVSGAMGYVYMKGFPVGVVKQGKYFLHNHVTIKMFLDVTYPLTGYRIVGFEVEPRSIRQSIRDEGDEYSATWPSPENEEMFDLDEHNEIWYTYDVVWIYSHVRWASRWEIYLKMEGGNFHWMSLISSAMIVLLLIGLIALIMLRTLHRDIAKYNELATREESGWKLMQDESGWKLVHGDVFQKPVHEKFLAACLGSGAQFLGMSIVTLIFAAFGCLSPTHRGGLLQSTFLLFAFMGVIGGYASARFHKLFGGEDWKKLALLTALLFPGTIFGLFFFLTLLAWGQGSAGAFPFSTMFALLMLLVGVSVPLVFLGAYFGYRKPPTELPVRTNTLAREIPVQPWYMKPFYSAVVGGLLPFGAVFTELFFIMSSTRLHQIYYVFGLVVLVLIILIVTCAEVSIALAYLQLTSEDYHWWWRSFFASGSSGVYVFLYSWLHFSTQLQIEEPVSVILYFGYMGIMSCVFALLTGAIGLMSTFGFVKTIYGSIKIDSC